MAGAVKELRDASTAEATGRVAMVPAKDLDALAQRLWTVGHFLTLFSDMSMGAPAARLNLCGESFSVVMEDLAERCMAAGSQVERLGMPQVSEA